jgi:hypothetical protein
MLISKKYRTDMTKIVLNAKKNYDDTAYIPSWLVGTHNLITFTKRADLPHEYYASMATIKACYKFQHVTRKGNTVTMYDLPISKLQQIEYKEDLAAYAFSLFDH